ncbi:MAG: hypothetical protein AB7H93_13115 [Vicinamibacterales bacterium]
MAGGSLQALGAWLDDIARRRTTLARRRAFSQGGAVAAAVLLVTAALLRLVAPGHLLLVTAVVLALAAALAALVVALWPGPAASALQIARLVEERHGGLDDVVVTAVDYQARADHDPVMAERLARAAVGAVADLGADAVVAPADLARSGRLAIVTAAALLVAAGLFVRPLGDAASVASAYLLPSRIDIAVEPGHVRLRAGQALTVRARVRGADAVAPALVSGSGDDAVPMPMTRQDDGSFLATVDDVTASFVYRVVAGARRSDEFAVTVVHPPVVERIALEYHYPGALGLPVRTEDDGGDIYAPEGTEVRFTITADRPVAGSALALGTGPRVPLTVNGRTVTGTLTIAADDAYRVMLADDDGSEAPDDTEYFIRTLLDRPPDVRVVRPAGDRQVTPLEEVLIEARADDDFGITALDLVLQKPGDAEVVVPLPGPRDGLTASGSYLLFLEDLEVSPGDFVTYFVRARDIGRGKPPSESRSDMFFLEVKAFDDEFVAAQSQAMAAGAQSQGVQDLAAAQKEIVVATWKLDARGRRARNARSAADVRAVAAAQRALEQRAAREAGGQLQSATGSDPRRRRGRASANAVGDNPMGLAIEAMRKAAVELEGLRTEAAMPHELEALNQLLKAETDVKRRQVARQQSGGGGGGNRDTPDLSSLFDQELRKQQQTNYETPASSETRQDERQAEDPLERLRELARRQDAMSREQRDLASNGDGLDPETVKRRLERLSRDQESLRRELEELARQLPEPNGERQASSPSPSGQEPQQPGQRGQQGQASQGQPGQQAQGQAGQTPSGQESAGRGSSRQSLRDAAEEMRRASAGLQQQDPARASQNAERALERLRQAEQGLRGSTADDRRRLLGDLQLETRQLADAERRVSQELERADDSAGGSEARRQAAADQERLAGRAERLQRQLQELSGQAQSATEREAIAGAARDLESQRVAERMRQSARGVREGGREPARAGEASATTTRRDGQPAPPARPTAEGPAREGAAIARALEEVAGRLDAARDGDRSDALRLSDELSRARELRDRLAEVERSLERLSAEGQRRDRPAADRSPSSPGRQQGGSAREPGGRSRDGDTASAAEIAALQRQLAEQLRETRERVEALSRDNPELRGPSTPEQWQPSVSAPGTEAFKQDFARWESLKSNLLSALEKVERSLTTQLREQETRDRLNVGGSDTVPDDYRALVERYYRSLAAPRRQER